MEYIIEEGKGNPFTMAKKLCYFINSAWYFELHWFDRAKAALDAGYDVSLIANFDNNDILKRLENAGFKCYNSKMNEKTINPFLFIKDFICLYKTLTDINPDILHSITIKPGVISSLWCRLRKKTLVYSFVGLGRVFENQTLIFRTVRFFIIELYRNLFSNLNCVVIFEHRHDLDKISKLINLDKNKAVVIDGAGIDTDFFSFCHEDTLDRVKVLFASRLLWSKGLADLLKAKKIINSTGTDFDILVAGIIVENDNDAISLDQIQQWEKTHEITWLGTRSDIKDIIQQSNIVALPSIYAEGIPRILIEAGAVGRATITYDVGGCSCLVEDGVSGFVVERKNIDQLSEKLRILINDKKLRSQMGRNSRAIIESKYSSRIIISQTLKLYSEISY